MNKVIRKTTGIVLGMTLALVSGAPAIADDTELLLVTSTDDSQLKPNVVFILDTSGSMTTVQETGAPYDPAKDYSAFGTCDANKMYYTEDGTTPVCDTENQMFVAKDSWHCNASATQIAGVGTYTGVLTQYRSTDIDTDGDGVSDLSKKQWNTLEPGNSSDEVECEADSGEHGSLNVSTSVDVYPTNAESANSDGFTSDELQVVSWGSSGVNMTYTIFDGNYLNYKEDPATQDLSRSQIMKNVTKKVLNSVNNMNVGIMRFNSEQGGIVIQAPIDLDTNRDTILSRIDGLNADGWTPLSETLFESALFWQGLDAHYGELYEQHRTADDALVSRDPEVYRRPDMLSCSKNFNVLISDGLPTRDVDTPDLLDQLPNYATVIGTGCSGTPTSASTSPTPISTRPCAAASRSSRIRSPSPRKFRSWRRRRAYQAASSCKLTTPTRCLWRSRISSPRSTSARCRSRRRRFP